MMEDAIDHERKHQISQRRDYANDAGREDAYSDHLKHSLGDCKDILCGGMWGRIVGRGEWL